MIKLLPCILFENILIFQHWKWPAQGTGTVPIVSPHFRFLLHPPSLLGDRGRITKQSSVCIPVSVGRLEQKCFEFTMKRRGRTQQIQPCRQLVPCLRYGDKALSLIRVMYDIVSFACHCLQCFDTVGWASGRVFGL